MRTILLAASTIMAAALTTTPARAQDDDEGSFSGPRVEAIVGWDNFSAGDRESDSKDGVVYGGVVGYDFQSGGVVFGIEAELTDTSTSTTATGVLTPPDELLLDADRNIYVGGRVGYAFTPHVMGYVKAGYTNLRVQTVYDAHLLGSSIIDASSNAEGYRIGGGLEYRIGSGVYAKVEYRFSNYGDIDQYSLDTDQSQIIAGLGFRF